MSNGRASGACLERGAIAARTILRRVLASSSSHFPPFAFQAVEYEPPRRESRLYTTLDDVLSDTQALDHFAKHLSQVCLPPKKGGPGSGRGMPAVISSSFTPPDPLPFPISLSSFSHLYSHTARAYMQIDALPLLQFWLKATKLKGSKPSSEAFQGGRGARHRPSRFPGVARAVSCKRLTPQPHMPDSAEASEIHERFLTGEGSRDELRLAPEVFDKVSRPVAHLCNSPLLPQSELCSRQERILLALQLAAQFDDTGKCAGSKAAVAAFDAASDAAYSALQRDIFPAFLRSEQVRLCPAPILLHRALHGALYKVPLSFTPPCPLPQYGKYCMSILTGDDLVLEDILRSDPAMSALMQFMDAEGASTPRPGAWSARHGRRCPRHDAPLTRTLRSALRRPPPGAILALGGQL